MGTHPPQAAGLPIEFRRIVSPVARATGTDLKNSFTSKIIKL